MPGQGSKQQGIHELKQNYIISSNTKQIGNGAFGRVFQTSNKHDENLKVAIKVMDKVKLQKDIKYITEEIECLQKLDHPNIVRYYETYNDPKFVYLVMEHVSGEMLSEKKKKQPKHVFSEAEAASYMKSLFAAINHCHAQRIIHGDIKPDNIMINANNKVRLIDFGLSKILAKRRTAKAEVCGTPFFMSPEVIEGDDSMKSDIWSLGVILYSLVCGYLPFQGRSQDEIFRRIKAVDFNMNHSEFKSISFECKDLIRKLLVHSTKKRLSGR